MTMKRTLRGGIGTALLAGVLLSGCSRPAHEAWQPTAAPSPVDLATFTSRYRPVIASIESATSSAGFTWDSGEPSQTVVSKNGLCSWRLRQQGTYAANGAASARDARNAINRALVTNGFHATAWDRPEGRDLNGDGPDGKVMSSVDSHVALLEVTFGASPTIDVYSPAAGETCPTTSATATSSS